MGVENEPCNPVSVLMDRTDFDMIDILVSVIINICGDKTPPKVFSRTVNSENCYRLLYENNVAEVGYQIVKFIRNGDAVV